MLATPYTPPDPGHQVHRIRNQSGLLYSSVGFLFVHSRYILYPPVISVLASFRLLSAKLICSGFRSLDHWILSREMRGRIRQRSDRVRRKSGLTDSRDLRAMKSRLERTREMRVKAETQVNNLGVKKSIEEEHYPPRVKSRETKREAER